MAQPVLVAGARTPIGKMLGSLAGLTAPALGGTAVRAALERAEAFEHRNDHARDRRSSRVPWDEEAGGA